MHTCVHIFINIDLYLFIHIDELNIKSKQLEFKEGERAELKQYLMDCDAELGMYLDFFVYYISICQVFGYTDM
jgi:hypothetical protein